MKPQILALLISFGVSLAFGPLARSQEQPKTQPESQSTGRSEEKKKAVARAQVVPEKMGFDLKKYISVPLDKNEPNGGLSDSDIRPYVAPVAIEAGWWIVLFIPEKKDGGPTICVYLDKHSDIVHGYLIGSPGKPKTP